MTPPAVQPFVRRHAFPLILICLFLLHLAAALTSALRAPAFFLHNDGTEYLEGAVSFARTGRIISQERRYYEAPRTKPAPEAFRVPFLAVLGGFFIFLFRDPFAGSAVFTAVCATVLAYSAFRCASRLAGPAAGYWAVFLVTFHPLIAVFSVRYSSEIPVMMFLMLMIQAFLEAPEKYRYLLTGLAAGAAAGMRQGALLLLPAFAVFQLCRFLPLFSSADRTSFRKTLRDYLLFAAAFLLMVLPWSIRNGLNYGNFSPAGFFGGFVLYIGNNHWNAEAYGAKTGEDFIRIQDQGWRHAMKLADELPENMPPPAQQDYFRRQALEEIRTMGPAAFTSLVLNKVWHFIRPWPMKGTHFSAVFWITALWEVLLFTAGAAGCLFLRKRKLLLLFFLMIFCTGLCTHVPALIVMRHRIPFMDLVLIPAAAAAFARLSQCAIVHGFSCRRQASSDTEA